MINITCSDVFMLIALVYSLLSLFLYWDEYDQCPQPIKLWLILTYLSIFSFRGIHLLCQYYKKYRASRIISIIASLTLFPFLFVWTILGNIWLSRAQSTSSLCFVNEGDEWTVLFWLFIGYTWILSYILALAIAVYMWRTEENSKKHLLEMIRGIGWEQIGGEIIQNTAQTLERAETISFLEDYGVLFFSQGLTKKEISQLPKKAVLYSDLYKGHTRCTVCLQDFLVGDKVCELPQCGHMFHLLCIEVWLSREADCPNCGLIIDVQYGNREESVHHLNDNAEFLVEPLLGAQNAFI